MHEDYSSWDFDPSGYQYVNDYYGGLGDVYSPTYSGYGWEDPNGAFASDPFASGATQWIDNVTGATYSTDQILANQELANAFQAQFGIGAPNTNYGDPGFGTQTGQPGSQGSFFTNPQGNINWGNVIGGGATGLASLLGIAGIAQGLTGGGQTTTTQQMPGQSPLAGAAGQAGLQGYQQALNFGFGGPGGGLAGQLQGMAPAQQLAQLQALQGASGAFQTNPFLAQQPAQPGTPGTQRSPEWANAYAKNVNNTYGSQQLPLDAYLQSTGTPGIPGTPGGNPVLNQLAQQVQGYGQAQSGMLNASALGAMGLNNPSAPWLQGQATGMAQGNLPALNPALRAQVGATFEPAYQDLNRYLDTSLQQALERSRQQGFAGGNEVFREGTPGTILSPMWAEGMRQQGTLGGQRALTELNLAQTLPQLGGNLANQLFMQQLEQNRAMQAAAQGYTAPSAVALQGGLGLGNLNQNMLQLLGNLGQQGTQNQLNFLQAASAPLQGLSGLSGTAQAGAGMTQTQNTPFNLMSAFAPTASLLGGIGGAMGGYNATQPQRPTYSGWAG